MKAFLFIKIIKKRGYTVLTSIVIVLFLIQGYVFFNNPFNEYFPVFVPVSLLVVLVQGWSYITGIILVIKAVFCFKKKEAGLGVGFSIAGLLFFICSPYILGYLFYFIYPNV
jgi:hypothetical protein